VQIDPMKPMLIAPGSNRLKPKYDELLSKFAFKFNLRFYAKDAVAEVLAAAEAAADAQGEAAKGTGLKVPEPVAPAAEEATERRGAATAVAMTNGRVAGNGSSAGTPAAAAVLPPAPRPAAGGSLGDAGRAWKGWASVAGGQTIDPAREGWRTLVGGKLESEAGAGAEAAERIPAMVAPRAGA